MEKNISNYFEESNSVRVQEIINLTFIKSNIISYNINLEDHELFLIGMVQNYFKIIYFIWKINLNLNQ